MLTKMGRHLFSMKNRCQESHLFLNLILSYFQHILVDGVKLVCMKMMLTIRAETRGGEQVL